MANWYWYGFDNSYPNTDLARKDWSNNDTGTATTCPEPTAETPTTPRRRPSEPPRNKHSKEWSSCLDGQTERGCDTSNCWSNRSWIDGTNSLSMAAGAWLPGGKHRISREEEWQLGEPLLRLLSLGAIRLYYYFTCHTAVNFPCGCPLPVKGLVLRSWGSFPYALLEPGSSEAGFFMARV